MSRSSVWSLSAFFSLTRATCYANLILLDMIARIIAGEDSKSCSSSLYSFIQNAVASSLLSYNNFHSTQLISILRMCRSLNLRHQISYSNETNKLTIRIF